MSPVPESVSKARILWAALFATVITALGWWMMGNPWRGTLSEGIWLGGFLIFLPGTILAAPLAVFGLQSLHGSDFPRTACLITWVFYFAFIWWRLGRTRRLGS